MATKQRIRTEAEPPVPAGGAQEIRFPGDPELTEKASYIFDDPNGPAWHVKPDGTAYALAIFRGESGRVTMLDYAYALDPTMAAFFVRALVDGKDFPPSGKLRKGAQIQWFVARDAQPQTEWLKFTSSPATEIIKHQLGIPMTDIETAVYRAAMQNRSQPEQPAFPNKAVTETTARQSYLQPSREGKKLIGAYVDEADAKQLRAILALQGTTVQAFFADCVARTLAAANDPAELQKLAQSQVDRFRTLLRPSSKG